MTEAEREQIAALLKSGLPAHRVGLMTGRGWQTVARIRDGVEVPRIGSGLGRGRPPTRSRNLVEDDDETAGSGAGNPWIPPDGYDPFAERHNQRAWLAMLEAATDEEYRRLRAVVCVVLGLSTLATDSSMVRALIADRRPADELAGLYIAARGSAWSS
jgi:hypothetical protein